MPLFDFVKKTFATLGVGEKPTEKPVMKVTMLGARGVGKTSVLTSMYHNMNSAVNDTRLHIIADSGTDNILSGKREMLKCMFAQNNDMCDAVGSGIAGDSQVSTFSFDFGMNTENISIGLEIKDFPGEYLKTQPGLVRDYIEESVAVIVAIDTPHLMECDGKYNEEKNTPQKITAFFKEVINAHSEEKLILFTPLKCEKYYHEGRIDAVSARVEEEYKELLTFLRDQSDKNGLKGKFACVITPILTLGQIVFDDFERENGQVREVCIDGVQVPRTVKYKYLKPGAVYSPQYCEQPLYYLLNYVSKQYMKAKQQKETEGFFGKLKRMFELTPHLDELLVEIQRMDSKKVQFQDGFKVLFGRGKV